MFATSPHLHPHLSFPAATSINADQSAEAEENIKVSGREASTMKPKAF